MCRFLAYIGTPILMDDLLYKPRNSLVNQSIRAHESEEPLNGDGFGVGWYMPEIDSTPARFVSVLPAWNNQNLRSIACKIKSPCIFAHVRAASFGHVDEANCHPFQFRNFLFMHNGDIGGFDVIKRMLRESLSDITYNSIQGQTDSEHIFALFMDILLKEKKKKVNAEIIHITLLKTIKKIHAFRKKAKIKGIDYINIAVTDGNEIVAMRYVSDKKELAPTLYYSEGQAYECENGICRMKQKDDEEAVLIVSEKLTEFRSDWKEIPQNHVLLIERNLKTTIKVVELEIK